MPRVLPTDGLIPCFSAAERRGVPAHGLVVPIRGWLALLLLVIASGCDSAGLVLYGPATRGSGNIISQAREVEPFQEVQVVGAANVIHVSATDADCEIEADDNLLPITNLLAAMPIQPKMFQFRFKWLPVLFIG